MRYRLTMALMGWCAFGGVAIGQAVDPQSPDGSLRLDCSKPPIDPQRYICDSPYLRSLWKLVNDDARSLFVVNPMRTSLKREADLWFASIEHGQNYDLQNVLADRHRAIQRSFSAVQTALAARYGDQDINKVCVPLGPPLFETLLLTCKVGDVEGIAPGIVGQRQNWNGPAERDQALGPISAMAILGFDPSQQSREYRLIGWVAADAATIGKPFLVEGDGKSYLTIPKTENGSGAFSTDVVMAKAAPAEAWREIDAASWLTDLDHRLPRGLVPKSSYSLDLLTMRAITDIARDSDPNCCPTGGKAEIGLELKDDVLVINSLVLKRTSQAPRGKQ